MNEASKSSLYACPGSDVLVAFILGHMPIAEVDLLGEHIGQCARCESILETLQKDRNTVFSQLRQAARRGSESLSELIAEPEYQEFAAYARAIKCFPPIPTDSTRIYVRQPDQPTSSIPSQIGRYAVTREIGIGGFARVFLARDPQDGAPVAIKVPRQDRILSFDTLDAFLIEAQIVATLDHPGIVRVLDWGQADEIGPFVVMSYIDGRTLAEVLAARQLDRRALIEIVIEIAQALHHAHKSGLVHRDVKPLNILIDPTGKPFVADFGLAIRDEEQWEHRGELAGTRSYMAPEQVRCESHRLDGRTDIWALGVILFQALTARLPFNGLTTEQIEDEIQHRDPKPLRQIDDTISENLERICLKCLSKKMTDRYPTALDLAKELQHSAGLNTVAAPDLRGSDVVVPKGVRSFGPEDQHFFLDLLPGPRDALGLPDAIRTWKARLEFADPSGASSISVLYGPSGCGKTSFVRAGLLPRLGSHVVHAYVDAGAPDVEARLLRTLQHKCRHIAPNASLVETFTRLRSGHHLPVGCTKCVIVLDQFEQWLHTNSERDNQSLIQALRQCDGEHLQCLILVRDDFWMALTRFMNALEVPLREGLNSAAADLFDVRHARRVLMLFGRALGALPPQPNALTPEQDAFLDAAIAELASGGRVVCVQLALFAEMMKLKLWRPQSLLDLGGFQGVGVTFLEESLGRSAPARYRLQEAPIRAILGALLPSDATEIRDHVQSRASLLAVSGCDQNSERFEDILRILDGDLRLITPVDADLVDGRRRADEADPAASNLAGQYYQLTHDYLVPSIRDWMNRKRQETLRGRTELLLEERARLWNATLDRKQLPSLLEWVQICTLTRKRDRKQPEQRLLTAASQFHGIRTAMGLATALTIFMVASGIYRYLHGASLVQSLRTVETAKAETVIRQIQDDRFWTRGRLLDSLRDNASEKLDPWQRLRFELAAHSLGDAVDLTQSVFRASPPELALLIAIINHAPRDQKFIQRLWATLQAADLPVDQRFRAACVLANLDSQHADWKSNSKNVAEFLLLQERHLADEWTELLRPVGQELIDSLQTRFLQPAGLDSAGRYIAAFALSEYCQQDQDRLISLLKNSATEQELFLKKLGRDRTAATARLASEFAKQPASIRSQQERELLAAQRARLGTALFLLGEPAPVWPAFEHQPDPTLRDLLVDQLAAWHVSPLVPWKQLSQTTSPSAKYALLLALGEYPREELLQKIGGDLVTYLRLLHGDDPDPGIHSAAAWLLGRLNHPPQPPSAQLPLPMSASEPKKWYMDQEGHTLTIIHAPGTFLMGSPPDEADRQDDESQHQRRIDYSFAIATAPVTIAQHRRSGGIDRSHPQTDVNCPIDYVDHTDAMRYCNWLSLQNKIPFEEWCYEVRDEAGKVILHPVEGMLSKTGYRLPTEAEWEFACRAGTTSRRFCGNSSVVLAKYAWYLDNSEGRLHPVGQLRPNKLGLFDVYGNACQWTQTVYHAYGAEGNDGSFVYRVHESIAYRGCTFDSRPGTARSARRARALSAPLSGVGFRVARSLH